jgi:hypothetical protein
MLDTVVRRTEAVLPNRASGYDGFGRAKFNAQCEHPSFDLGGGEIYSTVTDTFRWDEALYADTCTKPD